MALLVKQRQLNRVVSACYDKPEELAATMTAIEMASFNDCMNHQGVARSTILLGMEPTIEVEYTVVNDGKVHWTMLASDCKGKLKLIIFEIREDIWCIKLHDSGDVDNYTTQINRKLKH